LAKKKVSKTISSSFFCDGGDFLGGAVLMEKKERKTHKKKIKGWDV